MTDLLRQEIATSADTIVVKVGTRVLTHDDGTLDESRIARLAEEICQLLDAGRRMVLVSSGAVGAGMSQLGLQERPQDVARLQAVAAVGQARLIEVYDRTFRKHGRTAAQILLTADDVDDRTRYLNVRNTIRALLDLRAVPIINENDTVAVDELMATFGDNDRLAALVTNLLRAPLLVILSDVEGLYSGDPSQPDAQLIPTVQQLDDTVMALVRDRRSGLGKGGMASKLNAARIVTTAGENVIIASGHRAGVLPQIMRGEPVGTLVLAQGKSISPRKRWIGFSAQSCGRIVVDAGARTAIVQQGRSLLAAGIVALEGEFRKGDLVTLADPEGREIARGLSNYHAQDVRRIMGLRSDRIAQVLGQCPYEEVIHRDNMTVVTRSA
ncbi:MAG: glutamate 5-kinase [Pirellulaceae bacterium]|jgi:glutamate 5-kinase|nr:glutamate 5-kinase [Pirellulaceae bacterium]